MQRIAATLVLLGALGCERVGGGAPRERLPLAPCQLASPTAAGRIDATCGRLAVPEDPSRPGGRSIELRVARVESTSAAPAADAVVFLAGGPGQASTEQYPSIAAAFERVLRRRDVLLVDQRGTGGSAPLACPALAGGVDPGSLSPEDELEHVRRCAGELGADLAQYTTEAAARDLDAVREALGYPQVTLVGVSYGTRLALVYLRLFPERVRALVLDGVAPPEVAIGDEADTNARAALDAVLARCAADPACRESFPRLGEELTALLARLTAAPARLRVAHPRSGRLVELTLTAELLRRTIFLYTYSTEVVALLPLLVHDAHASGDLSRLGAQALLATTDFALGISEPLHLSVLCAEDVPFFHPAAGGAFLGVSQRARLEAACGVWPHASLPASIKEPVTSEVPALLLSGGADPVTPPRYAELAARGLSRSRQLVVPDHGHGILYRGCLPRLLAAFIDRGSAGDLDTGCLERLVPMPFFVDFSGPQP